MRAGPLLLGLAFAAMACALSACPGDRPRIEPVPETPASPSRSSSSSAPADKAPPRVTLVVAEHAFVLAAPDDGTELLGAEAASALHPAAVAGLRNGTSCFGVVLPFEVEQGASLKAAAAVRLAGLAQETPPLADQTIAWNDLVRYCDEPAMRAAVNGRRGGHAVRLQQTVVLAEVQGRTRAWEIRVESSAPVFGVARRCHDRLTAAFELDVLGVAGP